MVHRVAQYYQRPKRGSNAARVLRDPILQVQEFDMPLDSVIQFRSSEALLKFIESLVHQHHQCATHRIRGCTPT
jgi:hypothetical protein